MLNNPIKYTDPNGYHYCDSKYAAEDVCDWYNKADIPDDTCRANITCYQAYLTYNDLIFQLGRIPTANEILYMTAQTEGYSNKGAEYHGAGNYEDNFIEGLARNYYQPYQNCLNGSAYCTESKLYWFMSGYEVWFGSSLSPGARASNLIDEGLYKNSYRSDLEPNINNITNKEFAKRQGWAYGIGGPSDAWQWHNWIRPPDLEKGEALGWIYEVNPEGNYFWIMTIDQTNKFKNEIENK